MSLRLLIVESDPFTAIRWRTDLAGCGYEPEVAAGGRDAISRLTREPYDGMILDVLLPDVDAREVLAAARRLQRQIVVIATSTQASVECAVEYMQLGAADFLVKPAASADLFSFLRRALGRSCAPSEQAAVGLVGDSAAMSELREIVQQVSDCASTVLITGESGTGKELVARALHEASSRRDGPFVALNCAAIPESLLESELFGHVRGAFTGATQPRVGRFEMATGGTLFLDEIGDMPLPLQVKLLRVLQERVVEPVGGSRSVKVDVRIIAATHQDLEQRVREGQFREDLYYRLNVIPIAVPPLRERSEDIPALCAHFLARANRERSGAVREITPAAMEALQSYPWPGNVRELENLIERLVVVKRRGDVGLMDLPVRYREAGGGVGPRESLLSHELPVTGCDLRSTLAALESRLISQALSRAGGNKNRAASLLGLNRTTLVEKLKRLRLEAAA
jgi:DNA-binding NtrC family response regulator